MVADRRRSRVTLRCQAAHVGWLIVASVAIVFSAGCDALVRKAAVDAIAAQIRPPNVVLVNQLESAGNPAGEGLIVFVKAPGNCAPRYAWIWVNENIPSYALDSASRTVTPELQALSEAPEVTLKRIGSDAERLPGRVREMLCNTAQR